ncbi:hypothetical protein PBI_VALIDUS_75 [Mycobacterium phage Validus]|uniref:Uncharacterized protein n=1 Tax=Mycobacterium phage Validus TaxID=1414747 RepID=V5UQD3_9CAUD|nr:hypothetical protein CC50_gp036 [Mycobacterium phage Validus]AHB79605.1 hypothetical protein PBI_VALIDUS_75 [Mycobacterium phage Validus]
MMRRPSPAAGSANSTHSVLDSCCAAQIAQIRTDRFDESVLTFSQVNTYKRVLSTDSTDFYGLTSRVEIWGVSAGRFPLGAVCGAHMQKSVLSVLTLPVANCGLMGR